MVREPPSTLPPNSLMWAALGYALEAVGRQFDGGEVTVRNLSTCEILVSRLDRNSPTRSLMSYARMFVS
jgi:hypothetical protein